MMVSIRPKQVLVMMIALAGNVRAERIQKHLLYLSRQVLSKI